MKMERKLGGKVHGHIKCQYSAWPTISKHELFIDRIKLNLKSFIDKMK